MGAPSELGQVSDCVDHNNQTIAADLSECLIMDILNDVIQFGLEWFASKGLHGLGSELNKGELSSGSPKWTRPSQWLCGP